MKTVIYFCDMARFHASGGFMQFERFRRACLMRGAVSAEVCIVSGGAEMTVTGPAELF